MNKKTKNSEKNKLYDLEEELAFDYLASILAEIYIYQVTQKHSIKNTDKLENEL